MKTHNSLVLDKILFDFSSSVTTRPIFCFLSIKTFYSHSCLRHNVYESRDPSCQLLKCHRVTDTPLTSLAATVSKYGNSKACLIDRTKKRMETPHDQFIDTWRPRMFAIMPMQRFLKFTVGFFRPEYSGSPLEVVQFFRSTKIWWLFHSWQTSSPLP